MTAHWRLKTRFTTSLIPLTATSHDATSHHQTSHHQTSVRAARLPEGRRRSGGLAATLIVLVAAALFVPVAAPAEATTGTISGVVFQDLNRDAVRQSNEAGFEGHRLDLFDANGNHVKWAETDAQGRYAFPGVSDGAYEVRYRTSSWWQIRDSWVPTTTGSLLPRQSVVVRSGSAVADIGWRPIIRSTDINAPISSFQGPSGLTVRSYNDVVTARALHDHVVGNFLVGKEAATTTIMFGYGSSSAHNGVIAQSDGTYTAHYSTVYVTYLSWVEGGDRTLAHEYGHAFGEYHTTMVQQDRTWSGYLRARGLAGDSRVNSSYEWLPTEIIAEDYRQLFATANARQGEQMNRNIPRPWDVPGLESWLQHEFTADGAPGSDPIGSTDSGSSSEQPDPEPEVASPVDEPERVDESEVTEKCHPRRGCSTSDSDGSANQGNNGKGNRK